MQETKAKSTSSIESIFTDVAATDMDIMDCKVMFLKHFVRNDVKKVMLVVSHQGSTKKVYCFPNTVKGLRAPFNAQLLVEKRDEYWNVTAVTQL